MSNISHKYQIGDKVILGEHKTVDANGNPIDKNWNDNMDQYVGATATITSHRPYAYVAGGPLYSVDIDGGQWAWREVNMTPVSQTIVYGAKCGRCNEWNEYVPASTNFICYGCKH